MHGVAVVQLRAAVTDRVVDTHILNLRKKIETKPDEPRLIVGVRGDVAVKVYGDDFEARTAAMAELRRLGPSVEVELRRSASRSFFHRTGRFPARRPRTPREGRAVRLAAGCDHLHGQQ